MQSFRLHCAPKRQILFCRLSRACLQSSGSGCLSRHLLPHWHLPTMKGMQRGTSRSLFFPFEDPFPPLLPRLPPRLPPCWRESCRLLRLRPPRPPWPRLPRESLLRELSRPVRRSPRPPALCDRLRRATSGLRSGSRSRLRHQRFPPPDPRGGSVLELELRVRAFLGLLPLPPVPPPAGSSLMLSALRSRGARRKVLLPPSTSASGSAVSALHLSPGPLDSPASLS